MRTTAVLALLIATACEPDPGSEPPDDTAPPDDTPECAEGEIPDGDGCVPEACGTGTWGDIEVDALTLYVDASAIPEGDGSAEAPFLTIQQALDVAPTDTTVAVAAGTYAEILHVGAALGGLHLAGRCRELVTLDASGGTADDADAGIRFELGARSATLSGFTVRDSAYAGLMLTSGELTMRRVDLLGNAFSGMGVVTISSFNTATLLAEDCVFAENVGAAMGLYYNGTEVTLRRCVVRDQVLGGALQNGEGINVSDGANLAVEDCEFIRNRNQAIILYDAGTVVVRDTLVQDTQPSAEGLFGSAFQVGGGTLEVEGCELTGNAHTNIMAAGDNTHVTVKDTIVRDTQLTVDGGFGAGIQFVGGGTLEVEGCEFHDTRTYGIHVGDEGTTATIVDTLIQGHGDDEHYTTGGSIWVLDGATATIDGCSIVDSSTTGILVGWDARATITNTLITGVHPDDRGLHGTALTISTDGQAELRDCTFEGNTGTGILVGDEGAKLVIEDTVIRDTWRGDYYTVSQAVVAQIGGVIEATRLEITGTEGPGLYASYAPSVISCTDCLISDSEFAGVAIMAGASVSIASSTISGTRASSNLGGGVGIYADPWDWAPSTLAMSSSVVSDNPIAGVWLIGQGVYQLNDNTIHGGEGETRGSLQRCGDAVFATGGITAWDGDLGLSLTGNTLTQGRGAGLFLHDASAQTTENSWEDNSVDLVVQGESCDTPPAGLDTSTLGSVELCPTWDYSTCGDTFELFLELANPDAGLLIVPPSLGTWLPK